MIISGFCMEIPTDYDLKGGAMSAAPSKESRSHEIPYACNELVLCRMSRVRDAIVREDGDTVVVMEVRMVEGAEALSTYVM